MKISEIQNKNIVSMESGKDIGRISDATIDSKTGKILSFTLDSNKSFFKFNNTRTINEITWDNIIKIGEDVILVK